MSEGLKELNHLSSLRQFLDFYLIKETSLIKDHFISFWLQSPSYIATIQHW